MRAVLDIIHIVLNLYVWLLIAAAILSWLIAFNVVNTRNQFVSAVAEFLYRITEPLLGPIRHVMPNLGGLDISPIILILIICFIQRVIVSITSILTSSDPGGCGDAEPWRYPPEGSALPCGSRRAAAAMQSTVSSR